MEFIKNNWAKLILSVLMLVGTVLTIVLLTNGLVKDAATYGEYADKVAKSGLFMLMAQLVFFLGLFTYFVLGMFEKFDGIKKYVLLGVGVVCLIFVILSISFGSGYVSASQKIIDDNMEIAKALPAGAQKDAMLEGLKVSQFNLTSAIFTKIASLIIFALAPITCAVGKIFKKSK